MSTSGQKPNAKLTSARITGSVHHGGFPDVVDESAVTPTNTNGGSNFDTTRGIFDPNVVSEYVQWTGNRGGPLVTSNNETTRSDLRLYESDSNATMRALFAQGNDFLQTCVDLMSRAMNTVPAGVQLGETISAIPLKPVNVTFDFDSNGTLELAGKIRVLSPAGKSPPSTLSIRMANQSGIFEPEHLTGTSVFERNGDIYGVTSYFPFSLAGADLRGTKSFSITAPNMPLQSFDIRSDIFVVPSLTTLSGTTLNATIAILPHYSCRDITLRVAVPVPQVGTLAPTIRTTHYDLTQASRAMQEFDLCSVVKTLDSFPTGLVTIEVVDSAQLVDTYLLNGGGAGW
ncbi:hypothetical protein DE146DRAFT_793141 [Phaeosphaeria sp. MPI-PUGE-AT-0046c]|nr:hypothetical protein DE146DRAFT_793141 [Phaeosphaeria sp. MPI-PUGE-AT-0046c]